MPKKKKAAPKSAAGKAKSGGKDTFIFGLNVSGLLAKLKGRKGRSAPVEEEEDFDEPTEVFVEVMESDEPPPPAGPKSRVRYGEDGEPPFPRAGKRSRPAAKRAVEDDGDFAEEQDEEEEAPKKRGPFGLFSLFGGKKKAKPSKSAKQEKAGKKKSKPAPPPGDDEDGEYDYEDEEELDLEDEEEEEEEEDISPRSRKGKKGKAGKSSKSARSGKKKKGSSPVMMLLLVLVLLCGLAYAAHANGFIDLSEYINNITDSLSMLLSMVGL